MWSVLAVAIGAVPGALLRYYLTEWCRRTLGDRFPYGTFFINITGCLAMGTLMGLLAKRLEFPMELRSFLVTGFLGSYTTFSTYGLDSFTLAKRGDWATTLFYVVGSSGLGVLAVRLGYALVERSG